MVDHRLTSRRDARARYVLSMAGKLWRLTYVTRARRNFVWRLLRLTGGAARDPRNHNVVRLSRMFEVEFPSWKWATNHKLLQNGGRLLADPVKPR